MLVAAPDSVRLFAEHLLAVMAVRCGGARLYLVAAAVGSDGGLNHYAVNTHGDVLVRGDAALPDSRVVDEVPELRASRLDCLPFAQLGSLWIALCDGAPDQGLFTLPELPPRWAPYTEIVRDVLGGAAVRR